MPLRYLIPSLDRAHAGDYRCIVRNRVGAIMQVTTEVQVACKFAPLEEGAVNKEAIQMNQTEKRLKF